MKTAIQLAVAGTILIAAAAVSGPMTSAFAAQGDAAATPSTTEYKIGVVDMDEVLKGYTKLKTQADALQAERDKLQKDLDAKTDALTKEMEAVKNAPEADRATRSDEIRSKLRNLRADMDRMQGDLNDKAAKLRAKTREEIIKTIQQIGADEKYHLILEGDADGRSTVIYFATPISITSKVIEKLNGAAPAAPAAAAAPKK